MPSTLTDVLHAWRDFYILVGTASATLVGLMFVALSIGASLFNEKHLSPMRAFFTPTAVHFSAVLFTSILLTVPDHSEWSLGGLLGLGALASLVYCARVLSAIFKRYRTTVDWEDRVSRRPAAEPIDDVAAPADPARRLFPRQRVFR